MSGAPSPYPPTRSCSCKSKGCAKCILDDANEKAWRQSVMQFLVGQVIDPIPMILIMLKRAEQSACCDEHRKAIAALHGDINGAYHRFMQKWQKGLIDG